MAPTLDIIIVNWNSGSQLRGCLDSIQKSERDGFQLGRVVVVDNASRDESAQGLEYPALPLVLIRNTQNLGFATACNQGACGSSATYFLFLNPDLRVLADSLQAVIQFMEESKNTGVGICGIELLNEQGNVSQSCSWFPSIGSLLSQTLGLDRLFPRLFRGHFLNQRDHLKSGYVDQVMGAFFLVRGNLIESLGGFDERFFVYFEDLDFSYRAHQTGWRSYYLASAQAYHKGGGCSHQAKARRLFYSLRSRILYCNKHFTWAAATGVLLATLLIEPFTRLAFTVVRGSGATMGETLQAYGMLWWALPTMKRMARISNGRQLLRDPSTS